MKEERFRRIESCFKYKRQNVIVLFLHKFWAVFAINVSTEAAYNRAPLILSWQLNSEGIWTLEFEATLAVNCNSIQPYVYALRRHSFVLCGIVYTCTRFLSVVK